MYYVFLLFVFAALQTCSSTLLFRIKSTNSNVSINSSYFLEILEILTTSEEIWLEHDFTDPELSRHIYECAVDKMTPKLQARIRAKTWSEFLNETNAESEHLSPESNNTAQWRQWFINKQVASNNYFWRNRTITNDIILDHRIILEAYQRGITVHSLESIPDDCFQIENSVNGTNSSKAIGPKYQTILSRIYNCGLLDEDFIREVDKYLDLLKMKHRNEQMTKQIRQLLQKSPQKKYLFAIGAAHLFGNFSVPQILQDQYLIESIDTISSNFSPQNCTDEEFDRLMDELNPIENAPMGKRFLDNELFNRFSASFLS